ncbi:hypothetical protein TNCV_670731 [Trichonephila clavipes]|nr:hypothetical protein TNCV_670731 [Trichonephila clavipes]
MNKIRKIPDGLDCPIVLSDKFIVVDDDNFLLCFVPENRQNQKEHDTRMVNFHIPDCWGISLRQLFGDQDLACDILMQKGQIDLV